MLCRGASGSALVTLTKVSWTLCLLCLVACCSPYVFVLREKGGASRYRVQDIRRTLPINRNAAAGERGYQNTVTLLSWGVPAFQKSLGSKAQPVPSPGAATVCRWGVSDFPITVGVVRRISRIFIISSKI